MGTQYNRENDCVHFVDHILRIFVDHKGGNFGERDCVYQQLWALPKVGKYFVQVCTFTAAGNYSGSGVRVDPSMIIGKDSDCMALRVQEDEIFDLNIK